MKKNIFVSVAISAAGIALITGYANPAAAQYYSYNADQPQVEVDMSVLDSYGAARNSAPRNYDKRTYPLVPPVGAVSQESLMSEPPALDANPLPPPTAPLSPTSPPAEAGEMAAPVQLTPPPVASEEAVISRPPQQQAAVPQTPVAPRAPEPRILKPTAPPDAPLPAIEPPVATAPPVPAAAPAAPFKKMQPIISYPDYATAPDRVSAPVDGTTPPLPRHKPVFKKSDAAPAVEEMPPVVTEEPEIDVTTPRQKPRPPQDAPKVADIEWDEPVDVAAPVAPSKPLLKPKSKPDMTAAPVEDVRVEEVPVAEEPAPDEEFAAPETAEEMPVDTPVAAAEKPSEQPVEPPSFSAVPTTSDLSIVFADDSVDLDGAAEDKLKNVIQQMNTGDSMLQVRAYAAGQDGSKSSARRISLSRALAVRSYLMDNGIKPHRVNVRALGSETDRSPVDRVDLIFAR